jgi:CHAT domain-containing protein
MSARLLLASAVLLAAATAAADPPAPMGPGDSVTRTIATGQVHRFVVQAAAGEYVEAVVLQAGVEIAPTVTGPDGAVLLASDSPSGPHGTNPIAFVATADGAQEIALRAGGVQGAAVSYTLRVEAIRVPEAGDLARAEAVLAHARWAQLMGDSDRRRGALPLLREALLRWQALGDRPMEMWTGLTLGAVLMGMHGEPQQCADAIARPLQIALEDGDEYAEARTRYNLAQCLRRLGRIAEARAHFERSAALHRAAGRPRDLSNALRSLGDLAGSAGDDQAALDLTEQAAEAADQSGDAEMRDRAALNLAQNYSRMSEYALALETLDRPFPGFAGDRQGRCAVWTARGGAHLALGDRDRAYQDWLEAYEEADQLGNGAVKADVLQRLADWHRSDADWDTALALAREAAAIFAASGDRNNRTAAECRVGAAQLGAGALPEAALAFTLALELAGDGNAGARLCALVGLGKTALGTGDLSSARAYSERAVELAEGQRGLLSSPGNRAGVLARMMPAFELLTQVRMLQHAASPEAGHAEAALGVAEAGRARSLLEVVADGRVDGPAGSPRGRPLGVAALQRDLLDADTLLLEYALGDHDSYLWVVATDAVTSYRLPGRAAIEAAVRPFRERLSAAPQGPRAIRDGDARRLGELLLGPASGRLQGKRLLVVASDALQYVPFAALPDPRTGGDSALLERNEVTQAPSASTVAALRAEHRDRPPGPRLVAVLADPVYERSDPRIAAAARGLAPAARPRLASRSGTLGRLPFSRREAQAIVRAAGPGHARSDLGFAASRAAVLGGALEGASIVHFAAHGLVDSAQPARSGIVLSLFDQDGRAQEGFLRLRDVYELPLSADLVVLSGCETALGRDLRGEGLVGLTTGFLYRGARQVVASLWRVDDLATSELMARFYRALLRGGQSAPAALRTAQREMAADRRWSDPYYWAGFVVQGDWR